MNNWFEDLENEWRYNTFMAAALIMSEILMSILMMKKLIDGFLMIKENLMKYKEVYYIG